MLRIATIALVFFGGFVVMVLEMIGVLYLAKDFGSSFYVWTSQIGVILMALSLGYAIGGALAGDDEAVQFGERSPFGVPDPAPVRGAMRGRGDHRLQRGERRRSIIEPEGRGYAAHAFT